MTDAEWLAAAGSFVVHSEDHYEVRIDRCLGITPLGGRIVRWAVRDLSRCLNRDGVWEYEPQPSSRDAAFIERCRFASKEEALAVYEKAVAE